jgi:hypothetical protein
MNTDDAILLFKEKAHDATVESQAEAEIEGSLIAKQTAVNLRTVAALYEIGAQLVQELDAIYKDMAKDTV